MTKRRTPEEKAAWATYMREWHRKNKHKGSRKRADLKKNYGMTLEQYNEKLSQQEYVCKICKKPETQTDVRFGVPYQLAVDHCHKTGKIRDLLCSKCNRTLGMVDDNIEYLEKLAQYLASHNRT